MTRAAFSRVDYPGGAVPTTIPGGLASGASSFIIADSTDWPDGSNGKFLVAVDLTQRGMEKIECLSRTGTLVTIDSGGRGADGQGGTGTDHATNCTVQVIAGAQDFDEANQIGNVLGNLGAGSLAVGAGAGTKPTELTVGTSRQGLIVIGGVPTWGASLQSLLTATGDIPYASGASTPARLAIGSTGQVLTVAGGLPTWATPFAISTHSGHMASDTPLGVNTPTKVLDTASLAVGTWVLNVFVTLNAGPALAALEAFVAVDTATATLEGNTAGSVSVDASLTGMVAMTFTAVVTVAGTIKLVCECSGASGGNALAATPGFSFSPATGYTAIRIA